MQRCLTGNLLFCQLISLQNRNRSKISVCSENSGSVSNAGVDSAEVTHGNIVTGYVSVAITKQTRKKQKAPPSSHKCCYCTFARDNNPREDVDNEPFMNCR